MRRPKPCVAKRDEVTITREDNTAVIAFHDGVTPTTNLVVGEKIRLLSDDDILDLYNQSVRGMEYVASTYRHIAKEIPESSPQIVWKPEYGQWGTRGDVLRCYIDDGGEDGEAVIGIDDQELTMHEFGKLLSTFAGWGMRLVIVPDDELTKPPTIQLDDADD